MPDAVPVPTGDVVRLVVTVEVDDATWRRRREGRRRPDASFGLRLEVELAGGSRVLLRDDRGWTTGLRSVGGPAAPLDVWEHLREEDVLATALPTALPEVDLEHPGPEDLAAYEELADLAAAAGVVVGAEHLRAVPHVVEPGPRLVSALRPPPAG